MFRITLAKYYSLRQRNLRQYHEASSIILNLTIYATISYFRNELTQFFSVVVDRSNDRRQFWAGRTGEYPYVGKVSFSAVR